jgi:hypothetical protein
MATTRSFAPVIAAVLLLLPVLYVASYLALVVPDGIEIVTYYRSTDPQYPIMGDVRYVNYRIASGVCDKVFWPLERLDRTLRPAKWAGFKSSDWPPPDIIPLT